MAIAAIASSLIAALHARTLKKIADTNRMTVSYRESAVPFCYLLTPHKAVGFSADLTDAVVDDVRKKLKMPGLQIAYIPVTGQNRNPLLVNDTYDLEGGSTTNTAARSQDVSFSISLFYAGTRVLVKKASRIRGYADLAGKTVATAAGSTNEKSFASMRPIIISTSTSCLRKTTRLVRGRSRAIARPSSRLTTFYCSG